jgi:hypothetical protein
MKRAVVLVLFCLVGCADTNCPSGRMLVGDRCLPVCSGDACTPGSDGGADPPDSEVPPPDGGMADASCASTDVPDELGLDENCDGIDGDVAMSVFVATTGDDSGEGTRDAPVRTISRALDLAIASDRTAVLIASGAYGESITLVEGVSIHGGYDESWARTGEKPTVHAPSPVLIARDLGAPTTVSTLRIEADDAAPGTSAIAAVVERSDGLVLARVHLVAGRGGDGADAAPSPTDPPAAGRNGGAGGSGVYSGGGTGCSTVSASPPMRGAGGLPPAGGCRGGRGGIAGEHRVVLDVSVATAGETADDPVGCDGADGGRPGGTYDLLTMTTPPDGWVGGYGRTGSNGGDGLGGAGLGSFTETLYSPAAGRPGDDGARGQPGGGGGGGIGCRLSATCYFSGGAGGGGGAGGLAGRGGDGGRGGGASASLVVLDSAITLVDVLLVTRGGGRGGAGATGQPGSGGGAGGDGGAVSLASCGDGTEPGRGGRGGIGGSGGIGGAGGGGGGGPSVGLVLLGDAMLHEASSDVVYEVGLGGTGGDSPGNAGEPGMQLETLEL